MRVADGCFGVLAWSLLACGPGLNQSNGVKMGEALAFAAAAGAAQVAQSVAEQNARNSAPVTHASGVGVSPACDQGQYACVTVTPAAGPADVQEPDMGDDDARDYVLGYVNGVRKLNGAPALTRDASLEGFAQAGSEQLAQDHRTGQHFADHAQELHAASAEVQGSPDGAAPGTLQDQIAQILLRMTAEGPGGMHHDVLLRPEWRKLGVGIVKSGGRMFFTIDFTK